jgi:hypothetical protein
MLQDTTTKRKINSVNHLMGQFPKRDTTPMDLFFHDAQVVVFCVRAYVRACGWAGGCGCGWVGIYMCA